MTRCEYNQECSTARNYNTQLVQLNAEGKQSEKTKVWNDFQNKCSHNYENCPERKKFEMEAED